MNALEPVSITHRDLQESLTGGLTLVTANRRLARELHQLYRSYRSSLGHKAWETPTILPYEGWLLQLGVQTLRNDPDTTGLTLLNTQQSRQVWRTIIQEDIHLDCPDTKPLWNLDAVVENAMRAWQLVQYWDIPLAQGNMHDAQDHKRFHAWTERYRQRCREHGWADIGQLGSRLIRYLTQNGTVTLANTGFIGFVRFNALQKRLLGLLAECSGNVRVFSTGHGAEPAYSHRQYRDAYGQWLGAAQWARSKLEATQEIRLGIVVPDIAQSRQLLEHAFSQVLCPEHLVGEVPAADLPFHISTGRNLCDYPLIKSGLRLLSLYCDEAVPSALVREILLDPFITDARTESDARNSAEARCRQRLTFQAEPARFVSFLLGDNATQDIPAFRGILESLLPLLGQCRSRASYGEWAERFQVWLRCFGWPGEVPTDSDLYQIGSAFQGELSALRKLDMVCGPVRVVQAMSELKRRVSEQPFQPQASPVQVEVLSPLECIGLDFDSIWIGNLTEQVWPAAPSPSPFIPLSLQKSSDYPGASIAASREHAADILELLGGQTREVVYSRPRLDNDVILQPSSLISFPDMTEPDPVPLIARLQRYRPVMEYHEDRNGLPVAGNRTSGGISLITDQAACPFRAYARHRLGADYDDPREEGLDALDRGTLVHEILHEFWKDVQSSSRLSELEQSGRLARHLEACILEVAARYSPRSGFRKGFQEALCRELGTLLLEWLALELNRKPFDVVSTESSVPLALSGLHLDFRVDRIDRTDATGKLVIMDYKTGHATPVSGWTGERPDYPQLAAYCLALEQDQRLTEPPAALVIGQIRSGDTCLVGFHLDTGFYQDAFSVQNSRLSRKIDCLDKCRIGEAMKDWKALLDHWRETLSTLADRFSAGHAQVDPVNHSTCRYCNLSTLCRITESATHHAE